MNKHIYAFGSICRGEVDISSDVDLLALVEGFSDEFDPNEYSIYSYSRIDELWREGNPFAWHLYLEAKLLFATDKLDYLRNLSKPSVYKRGLTDCEKFRNVFLSANESLSKNQYSEIFDLSSVFLSIRNFATCYSLAVCQTPDFSRNSAKRLGGKSIPLDIHTYRIFERARLLCTRGIGEVLSTDEITRAKAANCIIDNWMSGIIKELKLL